MDARMTLVRTRALSIACAYCRARIGEPCVNPKNGAELRFQPAHTQRLLDSGGL